MNKTNYVVFTNVRMPGYPEKSGRTDILFAQDNADGSGKIIKIGSVANSDVPSGAKYIDGNGCFLFDSFTDMGCRLRERSDPLSDDFFSCTSSAVSGGYSTLLNLPDKMETVESPSDVREFIKRAKEWGLCGVYPAASLFTASGDPCDYKALHDAGAAAFYEGQYAEAAPDNIRRAMLECAKHDYLIISAYSDKSLSFGSVNEGKISDALHVRGIPESAEIIPLITRLVLSAETGCRIHIPQVSTARSVEIIRAAKSRGIRVTCDTSAPYFSMTESDVLFYGSSAKLLPPLRGRDDVSAVIAGIADGTIDCITSAHTPHIKKDKNIAEAEYGAVGLQTAFSSAVTYLVRPGHISMNRLYELLSIAPASILNNSGEMSYPGEGDKIHPVLLNPSREMIVSRNMLRSKSYNTPYLGMTLYGTVEYISGTGY